MNCSISVERSAPGRRGRSHARAGGGTPARGYPGSTVPQSDRREAAGDVQPSEHPIPYHSGRTGVFGCGVDCAVAPRARRGLAGTWGRVPRTPGARSSPLMSPQRPACEGRKIRILRPGCVPPHTSTRADGPAITCPVIAVCHRHAVPCRACPRCELPLAMTAVCQFRVTHAALRDAHHIAGCKFYPGQ